MSTAVMMPRFGMMQDEATVIRWLVQEGDAVEKGDPIMEVETDKVAMEVEAPETGIIRGLRVASGDVVPVTGIIATILQPGEPPPEHQQSDAREQDGDTPAADDRPRGDDAQPVRVTPVARRVAAEAGIDPAQVAPGEPGRKVRRRDVEAFLLRDAKMFRSERVRATPAARRVAREHNVALARISGSGPRGRIQEADAMAFVAQARHGPAVAERLPLRGMRRTIAERMQHSAQTAPHVTFTVEVDMSAAQALRRRLNERAETHDQPSISVTALLVKVSAWALQRHRFLNATLQGDEIVLYEPSNVGVAVALEEGLIVPVVHEAQRLGLATIAARLDELADRARRDDLTPNDVEGGTFTISNLGMFGIDQFTAIVNPPQSAILAVGRLARRQMVVEDDEGERLAIRPIMRMTLSADHRIVDGAVAARFLQDMVTALADPGILLY